MSTSSLNVRLCDIVSDGPYSIGYKTGNNPYPENSGFTSVGTGLTATTITLTGLSFNTQYWVKMIDETTDRYIIRNISTNHSKTYPCYGTMCFNVDADCDITECQCKTYGIQFAENCNEILYFTSCDGASMSVQADYFSQYSTTTFEASTLLYLCSCTTPVIDCSGATVTQISSECISVSPTPTNTVTLTATPTLTPTLSGGTPTPTPTNTPTYKSWTIQRCTTGPCIAGQCGCSGSATFTVYTTPIVTNLTTPGVTIYTNTSLTTTFDGYFSQSGIIWEVLSGLVSNYCDVGVDPC
jgi:hypothetical protein